MKHKSIMIIASVSAIVVATIGVTPGTSTMDSRTEIQHVLSTFGATVEGNNLSMRISPVRSHMKESDFVIVGSGPAFAIYNETHGNFSISVEREWDMARGLGRTGAKKWASEGQARQYLLDKVRAIAGEQPGNLYAWKYSLDSTDSRGRTVSGSLDATYDFTFSGHPMVDRFCGYKVKLDPQDGALASFRKGSRPPEFESAFTPFSEANARARAASIGYRMTSPTDVTAKLGWAVPKGATRATLAYYMKPTARDETSGPGYMVEAKPNGRHWALGP